MHFAPPAALLPQSDQLLRLVLSSRVPPQRYAFFACDCDARPSTSGFCGGSISRPSADPQSLAGSSSLALIPTPIPLRRTRDPPDTVQVASAVGILIARDAMPSPYLHLRYRDDALPNSHPVIGVWPDAVRIDHKGAGSPPSVVRGDHDQRRHLLFMSTVTCPSGWSNTKYSPPSWPFW